MPSDFLTEKEKKTLELDARRKIYFIVKKYAGSHFREIERKSGLSTGPVKYHLDYLTKEGLIKREKKDNNVRYFPKEFTEENKEIMGFLRQESIRKIIIHILTSNGCAHEDIVNAVTLAPSTVSWHLKKLESAGVLGSARHGRKTFYSLLVDKNRIANLLISYQESFLDKLVDNIVEMWEI